jgi:hypothetical protein
MTLDAFIEKTVVLEKALQSEMPAISDEIALNAIALIKNRIIDKGEGINGASYSTKPMLATREQFVVKSAFKQTKVASGKKGKKHGLWIKFPNASKAVPVMELPNGYKQFREIQGREGSHVNLSYSGKMWQAVTIVARMHTDTTYATTIGGNNAESQNKLRWMTDKYGPFLTLVPEEETKLKGLFEKRVQAVINRTLQ